MSDSLTEEPEILVYGTICLDRFLLAGQPGTNAVEFPGGEAFNTAVALAGFGGVRVALTGTAIGDDAEGLRLQELLTNHPLAQGIDLNRVPFVAGAVTPVCTVRVDEQGERFMSGRGFAEATPPPLDSLVFRNESPFVFTVDPNLGYSAVEATQKAARAGCFIISMDCAEVPEILAVSEIAMTSAEWIRRTLLGMSLENAARHITEQGAKIAIVTDGANGGVAFVSETSRIEHYAAITPPAPIRDTTGAGDVFRAGLCFFGVLHSKYGLKLSEVLPRGLRFASAAAAVHCTHLGGSSRSTITEIMRLTKSV